MARSYYWRGWGTAEIADELGLSTNTVNSWKTRDRWDDDPVIRRIEDSCEMRLNQLIFKEKKTGSDFKEIDLLGRQIERTARVRRYGEEGGHEGDLNPNVANRNPTTLTDMQRAARFLYLQRLAFGGKVAAPQSFGVSPGLGARFDVSKLVPLLDDLHERMTGVIIERLDWRKFIARWDRPHTLFYLDPPYYGNEKDYGPDIFSRDDFTEMAELLGSIKGRFILSINDHPDVREIFAAFDQEQVRVRYTVGGAASAKDAGELVISG